MQSAAAKETTVLGTPSCATGFQVVLIFPAGQVACFFSQSMLNWEGSNPVTERAWREVSS
ncbi:MAG: hypothetical protein JWL97_4150 [Gemmatimonadales bacterium]|nr:hypothetical protein [Gemmatimonadales bacterium]